MLAAISRVLSPFPSFCDRLSAAMDPDLALSYERIRLWNPVVNAVVAFAPGYAATGSLPPSPDLARCGVLADYTVLVKDAIDVEGLPTTLGVRCCSDEASSGDAQVVADLRRAGAHILGKVNLDELAFGASGRNSYFGNCLNPWDPLRTPGGSSGASAVSVATGMARLSLGTDAGGSVLIPASVNGVSGFRPPPGVLPRGGLVGPRSFNTIGLLSRSCADTIRALDGIGLSAATARTAVRDRPEDSAYLRGLRVGLLEGEGFDDVDDGVSRARQVMVDVLRSAGARVVPVRLEGVLEATEPFTVIHFAEVAAFLQDLRLHDVTRCVDAEILERLSTVNAYSATDYAAASNWVCAWSEKVEALFRSVDVLLSPTIPSDVPLCRSGSVSDVTAALTRYSFAFAAAGISCLSVPSIAHPVSGLPTSVLLLGPSSNFELPLLVGRSIQSMTGFHRRLPTAP